MFPQISAARLSLCLLESWYHVINVWQLLVHVHHKIKVSSLSSIFLTSTFSLLMCKICFAFFYLFFWQMKNLFPLKISTLENSQMRVMSFHLYYDLCWLDRKIWVENWRMIAVRGGGTIFENSNFLWWLCFQCVEVGEES